ncbi:MAG TPA: hypothetical protein VKZ98_03810 [Aquaticitalea sp.]|nr:hypothetical protein [Aquaticitalea sp.]
MFSSGIVRGLFVHGSGVFLLDGGLDEGWWEDNARTVNTLNNYAIGLLLFFVYV